MSQDLVLFDAISSAFWKKKEKEKGETAIGLFPRVGMPYWLCYARISLAVRCN
jgi:hypothetical protein